MKKMDEKAVKVISCAVAVGVMILLLSGDYIISHFIRVYPNQDYTEEKEEQKNEENRETFDQEEKQESSVPDVKQEEPVTKPSSDNEYDVSFMKQVTLSEVIDEIEEKDTVFVFFGRSTCSPCRSFVPVLKEVAQEMNLTDLLYVDQTTVKRDTDEYTKFLGYSEMIQNEFGATPFFMIFHNHQHIDSILGMDPNVKETLESKISVYTE